MMTNDKCGLYVHIPFCLKKCNYCDFCSFSNLSEKEKSDYVNSLISEISGYKREEKIKADTVFFGGGTPSLLSVSDFEKITDALRESFDIDINSEFTLELNPKTVTREKLKAFIACGVNRISIGLQSIHENEQKMLGRIHNYSDFEEAYFMAREAGIKNISVDLMYGIPLQTKNSFGETLKKVISLSPEHISAYGLIIEEGTPFFEEHESLNLPSEDEECDMYDLARETLVQNGYRHYEISNYAKPGYESKHNLKYWKDKEYIGFGVSAYSYFEGARFGNTKSLADYISEPKVKINREVISKKDEAYEYAMLALRLSDGISLHEYKEKFGESFLSGREEKIRRFSEFGLLLLTDEKLCLSEKGFYLSNNVISELL